MDVVSNPKFLLAEALLRDNVGLDSLSVDADPDPKLSIVGETEANSDPKVLLVNVL